MAYRSSSIGSAGTTGTSPTIAKPAGLADGDVVTLFMLARGGAVGTIGWPSGFSQTLDSGNLGTNLTRRIFSAQKTITDAAGEPSSWTVTKQFSTNTTLIAVAHSGRDDASVTRQTTNNTTQNTSPVTVSLTGVTALAGDDILWLTFIDDSTTGIVSTIDPPTSYTQAQENISGRDNVHFSYRDNVSAGATGAIDGAATLSSGTAPYVGLVVRIGASASGPTISGGTPNSGTTSTVSSTVTTDTGSGSLFTVASTSATQPDGAQIEAGQMHTGADAAGSSSQSITATGSQNVSVSGLPQGTTLYLHHVQKVGSTYSNIVTTTSFQTRGISAVDGDNIVNEGQTDVAITGKFGSATPAVRIKSGSQSVAQTVTANSASSITISPVGRGNLPYTDINHTHLIEVDTDA